MKVVFRNNETANLSAIASVCVRDADGKISMVGRHQTKKAEKVSCIHFRPIIHFNPDRKMTKALAETLVSEIKDLIENRSLSIEDVINLKAWRIGCLGVDLNTATDAQKTIALARLCVGWSVGRNVPTAKQLEVRTGLKTCTIKSIANTDDYEAAVKELLLNGSLFERRTAEEFKAWIERFPDLPRQISDRIRMREDTIFRLLLSVAGEHGIDADWIHRRILRRNLD